MNFPSKKLKLMWFCFILSPSLSLPLRVGRWITSDFSPKVPSVPAQCTALQWWDPNLEDDVDIISLWIITYITVLYQSYIILRMAFIIYCQIINIIKSFHCCVGPLCSTYSLYLYIQHILDGFPFSFSSFMFTEKLSGKNREFLCTISLFLTPHFPVLNILH